MKWQLPSQTPRVGETFSLTVLTDSSVDLNQILKEQLKTPFYWIQKVDKTNVGQHNQWTISIAYFRSGDLPLPKIDTTENESIHIQSIPNYKEATSDQVIRELKPSPPAVPLDYPWGAATLFGFGALAILLALVAGGLWWKRRLQNPKEKFDTKKYSYKKVIKLYETKVLTQGDLKTRSFLASELVRGYAQFCTRFTFLGLTTDELQNRAEEWKSLLPPNLETKTMIEFLAALDRQKFVPQASGQSELKFEEGFALIEKIHELEKR